MSYPNLVIRDQGWKSPKSVRYQQINAMLLNEFLKEHRSEQQEQRRKLETERDADAGFRSDHR